MNQEKLSIETIAKLCHQSNKVICESVGDNSQVDWEKAADWQKDSAVKGVYWRTQNPDAPASAQHEEWMRYKIQDGWVFGEVKDADKKTHPCLVPYDQLPFHQRVKDTVFVAIVKALI